MALDHGGIINKYSITIINIVACIIIFVVNLFDQIIKSQSIIDRCPYTLPFIVLGILCYIFRKKYKFNAYLFASAAILSALVMDDPGTLTGVIFLMFSLYIFQSLKTNIIILIAVFLSVVSKIFTGFSGMEIVNILFGYVYCLVIYYILIHPKKPNIYNGLDEITREIIEYKMAGWSTKQVADKVFLSTDAVQKRISRACTKYDSGNLAQLVYKLMKKGYIGQ